MTMKDAAERTGLTPKSIRFYESKGLLQVERGAENAYRHYTDPDIERLKLIKLLRWLGLSVEEIAAQAQANWEKLPETLHQLSERLELDSQHCLERQNLCDKLAKDWTPERRSAVIAEYDETITFLESDEGKGLMGLLERSVCMSLSAMILSSLPWLGPIAWLFFRIASHRWEHLALAAALALFSTVCLTLEWVSYFHTKKRRKHLARETNRSNRLVIPLVLLATVAAIALVIGVSCFQERFLAPTGWLFYENPWWTELGMTLMCTFLILSTVGVLVSRRRLAAMELEGLSSLMRFVRRTWKLSVPILLLLAYCFLTSGTYVTENQIVRCTPFHPAGVEYAYTDVSRVETGFGNSAFSLAEYKRRGSFFYRIVLQDGTEKVFHTPYPNGDVSRYCADDATYLELEEFDIALMALGIPKTSSEENVEYCDFDPPYVERFLRIIRRKPVSP